MTGNSYMKALCMKKKKFQQCSFSVAGKYRPLPVQEAWYSDAEANRSSTSSVDGILSPTGKHLTFSGFYHCSKMFNRCKPLSYLRNEKDKDEKHSLNCAILFYIFNHILQGTVHILSKIQRRYYIFYFTFCIFINLLHVQELEKHPFRWQLSGSPIQIWDPSPNTSTPHLNQSSSTLTTLML